MSETTELDPRSPRARLANFFDDGVFETITPEDDRGVLSQVDALLAKFLRSDPLHMNERSKVDGELLPFCQIEIRRLFSRGFRLGDQNGLDLFRHGFVRSFECLNSQPPAC